MINIFIPRNFLSFILCLSLLRKNNLILISSFFFTSDTIRIFYDLSNYFNFKIIHFNFNFYDSKKIVKNFNVKLNKELKKKKFNLFSCGFDIDNIIIKNKYFNNSYNLLCHGFGTFINYNIENSFLYKFFYFLKNRQFIKKKYTNYYTFFNSKKISKKMKKIIIKVSSILLKKNFILKNIYLNHKGKKLVFINMPFDSKLSKIQEEKYFNLMIQGIDKNLIIFLKPKYDRYLSSKNNEIKLRLNRFKKFLKKNHFKYLLIDQARLINLPIEIFSKILNFVYAKGQISSAFFSLSKILNIKIKNVFIIQELFSFRFSHSNESKLIYIYLFRSYYRNIKFLKVDI